MRATQSSIFEQRLIREIARIDQHISDLSVEKEALMRQLLKARNEQKNLQEVTRINSGQRIIAEEAILNFLKQKPSKSAPTDILKHVRKTAVHDLKENTLRTYLARLQERGIITNTTRGKWTLAASSHL